MLHSRSRLIGMGLAVVAVAGVGALAYAAISSARNLPRLAAERGHVVAAVGVGEADKDRLVQVRDRKETSPAKDTLPAPRDVTASGKAAPARKGVAPTERSAARETAEPDHDVHVAASDADVDVDKDRGKVRVRAPYTKVDVDPDQGRVRVRAPYVNLDIRW